MAGEEPRPIARGVARRAFASHDFEYASSVLADIYGDLAPVLRGDPDEFAFETSTIESDGFGLDTTHYGSVTENRYQPFADTLVVGAVRNGTVTTDDGRIQRTTGAGDLIWYQPDRALDVRIDDGRFDFLRIDTTVLGRVAHEIGGIAPSELRIHADPPTAPAATRYWNTARRWVAEHVLADDLIASAPLVRAEALDALARATLLAVPNTALDRLTDPHVPSAGRAEPATVRRAVAYIDAHAGEPIDLTRIAEAARISPRGLQAAFQRHRGHSPLQYLRHVRMAGAHDDLQRGDPTRGDTVGAIVARWGFSNPGRFAGAYAREHGYPPSDTLRH